MLRFISCNLQMQAQGSIEGGFMGRTNKLVDGCYTYWQGALFPLLESLYGLRLQPAAAASAAKPPAAAGSSATATRSAAASERGSVQQQRQQQTAGVEAAAGAAQGGTPGRRITVPPLPRLSGRSLLQSAADAAAALQALDEHSSASAGTPEAVALAEVRACEGQCELREILPKKMMLTSGGHGRQ